MKEWIKEHLKELNFNFTPKTKQLLMDYVGQQYEDAADYSDESLKRELLMLNDENELGLIFIQEYISSEGYNRITKN